MTNKHYYRSQSLFSARENVSFGQNPLIHWLGITILIVNTVTIAGLAVFVHPSDDLLKLQYNVYFGTSLHAPWWGAYILPGIGGAFVVIDLLLAYILYTIRERIAAYIVLLGAFFAHIALVVASMSVIVNNF